MGMGHPDKSSILPEAGSPLTLTIESEVI